MNTIPFDPGCVPGPEMARLADPRTIGIAIKRAKRPILVVGAEILKDDLIDKAIEIGKKGTPIAATAHSMKTFVEKGYTDNVFMCNMHPLANNFTRNDWMGFDGKGNYDVIVFLGVTYYWSSQMMSAVKNFATNPLRMAVSIDRYYHPNAKMSFENIRDTEQFKSMVDEVIAQL